MHGMLKQESVVMTGLNLDFNDLMATEGIL